MQNFSKLFLQNRDIRFVLSCRIYERQRRFKAKEDLLEFIKIDFFLVSYEIFSLDDQLDDLVEKQLNRTSSVFSLLYSTTKKAKKESDIKSKFFENSQVNVQSAVYKVRVSVWVHGDVAQLVNTLAAIDSIERSRDRVPASAKGIFRPTLDRLTMVKI